MFPINQLVQGDCTRALTQLPDSCVDLIVTDPPYGVCYQDNLGRTIANDDDPSRVLGAFSELYRVLKPNSVCVSFYGWGQVDAFFRAWRQAGFRPVGHIVWAKEYASRTRYLRYRHEQAYVLAKGWPALPAEPLDDNRPPTAACPRCSGVLTPPADSKQKKATHCVVALPEGLRLYLPWPARAAPAIAVQIVPYDSVEPPTTWFEDRWSR